MFDEYTERVLEHVRSRKGWYLTSRRKIRRVAYPWWQFWKPRVVCCPISSLDNLWMSQYKQVAQARGLNDKCRLDIVQAADDWPPSLLRAALLEAAGLSEKEDGA